MGSCRSLQLLLLLVWLVYMENIGFSLGGGDPKVRCIEKERGALLKFKQGLNDPFGLLSSWVGEEDCCRWVGVGCSNRTGHVLMLDLPGLYSYFEGEISPSLLDLQHLNYLDLSGNIFKGTNIPKFLGSLTKLRYLNLSRTTLAGMIPHELGNLSSLRSLDLSSSYFPPLEADNLNWLSGLSSLRHLAMNGLNLTKSVRWLQEINMLPSLLELRLSTCELPIVPPSLPYVNFTSLAILDLSWNFFNSSIPPWLNNISNSLVYLDLSVNYLHGPILDAFGKMNSLIHLDLSGNFVLEGGIPKTFGNLCNLKVLDLSLNNISGEMFGFLRNSSGCIRDSLESLSLRQNQLIGYMPDDLGRFSSLRELRLDHNCLNGTLPKSIGLLSNLIWLDVSSNSLEGNVFEAHFLNLSKLQVLDISSNSFVVNVSSDWVPPFQLNTISMKSCKLGPQFPEWLQTQKNYSQLDISNAEISDIVPDWFWNLSSQKHYLNLSYNHLNGEVPNLFLESIIVLYIDLSSNHFKGSLPQFSSNISLLDLSKNLFFGPISISCERKDSYVHFDYLDLSENLLSGLLPNCWMYWQNLELLNLANNNLFGKIPSSMGSLIQLKSLHLSNNNFSGELPLSLKNCTNLIHVDLGENRLSGNIPPWIGANLLGLRILRLPSNEFNGNIPPELCGLKQLQILDVAQNNISGVIPTCFGSFSAMIDTKNPPFLSYNLGFAVYQEYTLVVWKGIEYEYRKNLFLLKIIDLSSNNLFGNIPQEITSLFGLHSLNLSRNNLMGTIPQEIGQWNSLESLDLSRNQLAGVIPTSMSNLTFLGHLDLSNNNLSGRIPMSTQLQSFNVTAYAGNSELCGLPLIEKCPGDEIVGGDHKQEKIQGDKDGFQLLWFYVSMGLGFIVGFWGVCGTLLLKISWRDAYFRFFDRIKDGLIVTITGKVG